MQTLSEIRQLLAERGIRPKHRFGQNFLHDKNQLLKLVNAANVKEGDLVLEIGPGTGTLTEALLEAGAEVVACELDHDLAAIIEDRFARWLDTHADGLRIHKARLHLIRADALARGRRLQPAIVERLGDRPFKLVANLPYQIASPLMTTLLIEHPTCTGEYVTIQKEVAERLSARPSTKAYGPLSVIVQALAEVERIATLSPSCFWPEPEVTSAMVAVARRSASRSLLPDEAPTGPARRDAERRATSARAFARFVTDLFTKRRKQLGGIIGREHPAWSELEQAGISREVRPEALSVEQIVALWAACR